MEINDNGVKSASDNVNNSTSVKKFLYEKNNIITDNAKKVDNYQVGKKMNNVKSKVTTISNAIKTFALMVSAVIVGANVSSVFTPSPNVELLEFGAYGSEVYYVVSVDEEYDCRDIIITLSNYFTSRVQNMEEPTWQGVFEDLEINMNYTFQVKYGSKVLLEKSVKTGYNRDSYHDYDYDYDYDYVDDEDYSDKYSDADVEEDINISDDYTVGRNWSYENILIN